MTCTLIFIGCVANVMMGLAQCLKSKMQLKNGIAKLLMDIEPSTIYTYCYGRALNLAVGDTIKKCSVMKNTIDAVHEICKLVKSSPKETLFFNRSNIKYKLTFLVYVF